MHALGRPRSAQPVQNPEPPKQISEQGNDHHIHFVQGVRSFKVHVQNRRDAPQNPASRTIPARNILKKTQRKITLCLIVDEPNE